MRRVIHSVVVDRSRRRSSREHPTDDRAQDLPHPDQSDSVATRLTLQEALLRPTIRQRQVLVLRFSEDLSEAQTAGLMACSPGTVKSAPPVGGGLFGLSDVTWAMWLLAVFATITFLVVRRRRQA